MAGAALRPGTGEQKHHAGGVTEGRVARWRAAGRARLQHWRGMRRMLLLACAVGLCGSVAVVAFAADAPIAEPPSTPTPGGVADAPASGPFALAAARAQSEVSAERHRAARAAYAPHETGESRPSTAPRAGTRVQLISRVGERLGVGRRAMWMAVADVRRQIAPRAWSDARDEALRMLARELDRPFAEVSRAVRIELRHELKGYGPGYGGGR